MIARVATGEDGRIWSYGCGWPDGSCKKRQEAETHTVPRGRHLRYYGPRGFRPAAGYRHDLPPRGDVVTRWRT